MPVIKFIVKPIKVFCFRSIVCVVILESDPSNNEGNLATCKEPEFFETTKYVSRCELIHEQLCKKGNDEDEPSIEF